MNSKYGYYATSPAQPAIGTAGSPNSLGLFPVQIGIDVSGTFAMSLFGLAVVRPDGRAVAQSEDGLVDVSAFLVPGLNAGVYRIPALEVDRGDLIVTSDSGPCLIFVHERTRHGVRGLDPFTGNVVHYVAPVSPFFNFFVRVESVFGLLFAETGESEEEEEEEVEVGGGREHDGDFSLSSLLPLLLLSQGQNSSTSLFTLVLLMQAFGRRPH